MACGVKYSTCALSKFLFNLYDRVSDGCGLCAKLVRDNAIAYMLLYSKCFTRNAAELAPSNARI